MLDATGTPHLHTYGGRTQAGMHSAIATHGLDYVLQGIDDGSRVLPDGDVDKWKRIARELAQDVSDGAGGNVRGVVGGGKSDALNGLVIE